MDTGFYNETIFHDKHFVFSRSFYWNTPYLLRNEPCNTGFLLQRIRRDTNACSRFWQEYISTQPFCHTYYEAWNVVNGQIVYRNMSGAEVSTEGIEFDDIWNANAPGTNGYTESLGKCYRTSGITTMLGEVYFCRAGSEVYEEIQNCFRIGAVDMGGGIRSAYRLAHIPKQSPIFVHQFSHSWNLNISEDDFVNLLFQKTVKLIHIEEDIKEYIEDVLPNEKYRRRLCGLLRESLNHR